jgi:hypothetical protein
MIVIGDSVSIG